MKILKVFGSQHWHDDVNIVANRAGLINLKHTIEEALESGFSSFDEIDQGDGECYDLNILLKDSDNLSDWYDLPDHYIDDISQSSLHQESLDELFKIIYKKQKEYYNE